MVARMCDVLTDVLIESFLVCITMGDSFVSKRVYGKCLVMLPNKVTLVDLVELDIFGFEIILGIN